MDSHGVGKNQGGKIMALDEVKIPALILGINSDLLYPLQEQKELASLFPNGSLGIIEGDAGHGVFLLEQDQVEGYISELLEYHN